MNKEEILSEIKRLTKESCGNKAPGSQKLCSETGMRKSDWYPNLWLRWSDAIKEAGCEPNEFQKAYDKEYLVIKYVELIRELSHFPIEGELHIKKKNDTSFPGHSAFSQLGNKQERARAVASFCKDKPKYEDIFELCIKEIKPSETIQEEVDSSAEKVGYVYLIQHGSRNEYKIGMTYNPIRREGEIKLQLPEKVKPIHYIETDDALGIENYWHKRFANKRKEGEWFSLTACDIRSFKKWRKIY